MSSVIKGKEECRSDREYIKRYFRGIQSVSTMTSSSSEVSGKEKLSRVCFIYCNCVSTNY